MKVRRDRYKKKNRYLLKSTRIQNPTHRTECKNHILVHDSAGGRFPKDGERMERKEGKEVSRILKKSMDRF